MKDRWFFKLVRGLTVVILVVTPFICKYATWKGETDLAIDGIIAWMMIVSSTFIITKPKGIDEDPH